MSNSGRQPGGSSPGTATLARQIAPFGETGPPWKSSRGFETAPHPVRQHRVQRGLGDLVQDHAERAVLVAVQDQHDGLVEDAVGQQDAGHQDVTGHRVAADHRARFSRSAWRPRQDTSTESSTAPTTMPDQSASDVERIAGTVALERVLDELADHGVDGEDHRRPRAIVRGPHRPPRARWPAATRNTGTAKPTACSTLSALGNHGGVGGPVTR